MLYMRVQRLAPYPLALILALTLVYFLMMTSGMLPKNPLKEVEEYKKAMLDGSSAQLHTNLIIESERPGKKEHLKYNLSYFRNKDLYNLSAEELAGFFRAKERVYRARRERIARTCEVILSVYFTGRQTRMMETDGRLICYDPLHKIGYCGIPKVASSTWTKHFVTLAERPKKEVEKHSQALQLYAPLLWPLPKKEQNIPLAMNGVTSLVIVRHPLSRLASVYYQKIIDLGFDTWKEFNQYLITVYRSPRELDVLRRRFTARHQLEDNPEYPTPVEFLLYVLDDLKRSEEMADQHWRPQHGECPFCLFNFTVYSKMEELNEDTAYFLQKANLTTLIQPELAKNPSKSGGSNKEARFWSRVPNRMIYKLAEPYKLDFYLFEYSIEDYLRSLGLESDPKAVNEPLFSDGL